MSQSIGNAVQITDNETNFNNYLQGDLARVVIRGYGDKLKQEPSKIEFEKIKIETSVGVKFILN